MQLLERAFQRKRSVLPSAVFWMILWGTGVIPDIEVPAEQALQVAHERILRELLVSAKDDNEKAFLQAEMETLPLQ